MSHALSLKSHILNRTLDERANFFTHLLGCLMAGIWTCFLINDYWNLSFETNAIIISFSSTTIFTFITSCFYHWEVSASRKSLLRLGDHISIYLMIAGSITPIAIYGGSAISLSKIFWIWIIGILGIYAKIYFQDIKEYISVFSYLCFGWLGIAILLDEFLILPLQVQYLIIAGGIIYTLGIYFYSRDEKKYYHAIWHCGVNCACACHFLAISLMLQNILLES